MVPFLDRQAALQRIASTKFDCLIIGGGVTGAGIALDAASRGLKTLLIEQTDYAWGTSSRSTKLIHGGLRYLKQLEIGLVREVGQERAIVHRNAPHLVHPEELLLPIVEDGSLGKYTTPVGLWVYEKLAGVDKSERFKTLDRKTTLDMEPLLNEDIVRGGAVYREYRTDDARLVIHLLKTAAQHGAEAINYLAATDLTHNKDGQVNGLSAEDRLTGESLVLQAHCVVNAAGPWCDAVRELEGPVEGKRLERTKGVHLVFARERFPINRAVYFDVAGDERMLFAVPRGRTTYLGTTDTRYTADIGHPQTDAADVAYLLKAVNHTFPDLQLAEDDIESTWAGLRPLIHEPGKDPGEVSRKDEIFQSASGLLSIAGGKLTGYRKMAERITDMVMVQRSASGDAEFKECQTANIGLIGGDFPDYRSVGHYKQRLHGEGRQVDLLPEEANYLVDTYGTKAAEILERAYKLYPKESNPRQRLWRAEWSYAIEHEGVCTISDFLIRRTGRLYFDRPSIPAMLPVLKKILEQDLGISAEQNEQQLEEFNIAYQEALTFPPQQAGH